MNKSVFPVYKGKSAAQISLIPPKFNDKGWVEKQGAVLIETAVAIGKNANDNTEYGWANKVTISLGTNDINSLLGDLKTKLVHEWKGSIKTMNFVPGTGQYEGTFMLYLSEKKPDGTENKVAVPFSAGEIRALHTLLTYALPKILGW